MQFREHPALVCDGIRVWPPKWLHVYGPTVHSPAGEMGVLDSVFISQIDSNRVYVIVNKGEDSYMGSLWFEEPKVAQAVYTFFLPQVGRPLETVAATEFHFNLDGG